MHLTSMQGTGVQFVDVANASELATALTNAVSSSSLVVIKCATGNYGSLTIGYGRTFASGVVIQSNYDAEFNSILFGNVRNVTLQGLLINYISGSVVGVLVREGSSNITLRDMKITGTASLPGLEVRDSSSVFIEASDFYGAITPCILLRNLSNISIRGNAFHDYDADGMQIADVDGLSIIGNRVYNSGTYGGIHADFIQFYSQAGAYPPAKNVEISSNILLQGNNPGAGTQGIFMRDEGYYGTFDNFLIENNLVSPDNTTHGITCGGANDEPVWNNTIIRNNTVVRNGTSGTSIYMRATGSSVGNVVENNVANAYTINTSNVTQTGNVTAANTSYNSLFINGYRGTEPQDWLPVPGSAVDFGSGVGCDVLMQSIARPTYWIETTYAGLQVTCVAKPYHDPDLNETGFTYAWTSSDGGSGTGKTWVRTFASSGTYTVSVTVNGGETFEKTVIVS